jgi:hypothetical protein
MFNLASIAGIWLMRSDVLADDLTTVMVTVPH